MTRTTRIIGTNRTTRYDGNGSNAAAMRGDTNGDGEDQTVTMTMEAARKTRRWHSKGDGDRKDEEDEDETTKAKTRRTMKMRRRHCALILTVFGWYLEHLSLITEQA